MSVDKPLIVPHFKAAPHARKHVEAMRRLYCRSVVIVVEVMRRIDVFTMIEEMNAVEGHPH
jgi:hypothetical protein